MNDKKMACFMLSAVIAVFLWIGKSTWGNLATAKTKAEEAKSLAETTKSQRVRADNTFKDLEKRSLNDLAYYNLWKPLFKTEKNAEVQVEALRKLIGGDGLQGFSENFSSVGVESSDGVINKVARADLIFADDYVKLFNWLGKVEGAIQTSRINSCSIRKANGDAEIRMEVSIDIPLLADADTEES